MRVSKFVYDDDAAVYCLFGALDSGDAFVYPEGDVAIKTDEDSAVLIENGFLDHFVVETTRVRSLPKGTFLADGDGVA